MIIFVHTVQNCHKKYIFTQELHTNNLCFSFLLIGYTEKNPTHRPQLFHVTLPLLIFKHHTSARVEENFRKSTQEIQDINANLQSQFH